MRNNNRTNCRKLSLELLEQRLALAGQTWNMAVDFANDFLGGLPQENPNGVWTYLGTDGSTSSLVATTGAPNPGPNTFGVGAGWAEVDGVPSYARGGAFGFPTPTLAGHGPNRIVWTAPAEMDLGGVELTGLFTQAPFEPARQMQMWIYKNDFYEPLISVDADFNVQNTILPLPTTRVAMQPGDALTIVIDGAGPLGNGVSTFTASNVIIQEIQLEGDYNFNGVVDAADYVVWRNNLGAAGTPGMVAGDGTSTGALNGVPDGFVDQWDYDFWKQHFGNAFDLGGAPLQYHPAAIIVQTSGVTLPDGALLDITGSQTQGLQEAFNYSALYGWDLFVLPGTYTLNAHLDIEELQLRTFRFEDVTLNFTPNVTDFGIRFDSTMLTNWYWKGGAINAPNTTDGVLYQPRTPHPLDGPKFGTIGVVDSYFHFNVDITAATNKVTMNSQQSTINDLTLYFKSVLPNQINYVGGGFAGYNIFEPVRSDDPIPFDLFSTAGRVTVIPPSRDMPTSQPGVVFLPDGSRLNVPNTQSFGLQEAFDYAAAQNLDVLVFGRGVRNIAPFVDVGYYDLLTPLEVGDLADRMYRIYGVTLNYPVPGDTLQLGDIVNSSFEITGQVVATIADNAVVIRPNGAGVQNSSVRIQAVVGGTGTADTLVRLDPSLASIQNNLLYFHEVNTGAYGIKIVNPSATTEFSNNLVRTLHTHATANIGVQVGENATNSSRLHHNTVEMRTNTDGVVAYAALQVWGDFNTIDIYAGNSGLTYGARYEAGSNDNITYVGQLQGPLVNLGTNNTFLPAGSGAGELANLAAVDSLFAGEDTADSSAAGASVVGDDPTQSASLAIDESLLLVAAAARIDDDEHIADAAFAWTHTAAVTMVDVAEPSGSVQAVPMLPGDRSRLLLSAVAWPQAKPPANADLIDAALAAGEVERGTSLSIDLGVLDNLLADWNPAALGAIE